MIKRTLVLLFFTSISIFTLKAQDSTAITQTYSLAEIQDFAVTNSFQVKNTELDIKIAQSKKWETTAIGLPQISGTLEYQNFPDIPTQLMPDFISPAVIGVNTSVFGLTPVAPLPEGGSFPVQFGSKHNASWGLTAQQIIFNGEYIVGLKAAKIYLNLSEKNHEKTKNEIKELVTKTYYLILISQESINILDSVNVTLESLISESQKLYESGFLEQTDVQQLILNQKNTENSLISFKNQKEVLIRLLKYQAGIDFMQEISLTDNLSIITSTFDKIDVLATDFDINSNVSYKLMLVQENLSQLNYEREQTTVLPSVAAYYSYNKKAMRDSFDVFTEDAEWYPTGVWGIKVNIPIFASGSRHSKIKQRRYEYDQTHNQRLQIEQGLNLEVNQAKSDYLTALNTFRNQLETKDLSQMIYQNTLIKYKNGTESSLMLTQAQNQYFMSLTQYYQSLGNLIDIRVKLLNLLNLL